MYEILRRPFGVMTIRNIFITIFSPVAYDFPNHRLWTQLTASGMTSIPWIWPKIQSKMKLVTSVNSLATITLVLTAWLTGRYCSMHRKTTWHLHSSSQHYLHYPLGLSPKPSWEDRGGKERWLQSTSILYTHDASSWRNFSTSSENTLF